MKFDQSVKTHFELHEVVALSGFTKYMLDYLAREGILAPTGEQYNTRQWRGVRRHYSYTDVVLLRALHGVCASRGKIKHLKEALAAFRVSHGPFVPGERVDKKLMVFGNELYEAETLTAVRRLRDGQLGFSFLVDLWDVTNDVASSVVVDEATRAFRLTDAAALRAEQERQRRWLLIKARREAGLKRKAGAAS